MTVEESVYPVLRISRALLYVLLLVPLLAACAQGGPKLTAHARTASQDTPTPGPVIVQQVATDTPDTPTPTPTPATPTASTYDVAAADIPVSGIGSAPYGTPPALTPLEIQLTQKLFNQVNQDRSARNLPPYTWNATLSGGARLHSWNMYHCGFSHTCPDGESQFTRIANEGFGSLPAGECIAEAGPSNPLWLHVYGIQEGMINEPPTGFHRITLTSTTLHRVGVGVYVDPTGWTWFTEDFVA